MTEEEFQKLPRENRWSYSRLSSFINCPRQHHYSYIEEIRGEGNVHTVLGDLFHKILDKRNKGEDYSDIINEYHKLVDTGKLETNRDLLEFVINEYNNNYAVDNVLYSEISLYEKWEGKDYATFRIDCIYEKDGMNILRDYKTTTKKLKYNFSSVKYNQQLMLYKEVAEELLGIMIHGIEIDEIRLEKLEEVPYTKAGRPSADIKKLGLVKYETYLEALKDMGLEDAPEYAHILTELEKRGHPLFNRITIDTIDNNVFSENLADMYGIYKLAKTNTKSRKRSILCDYCDYKSLCEADYSSLDEDSRRIIIEEILRK